ncbi:MAG: phosphotransferase [Ilumatobacteraceae bacterium]
MHDAFHFDPPDIDESTSAAIAAAHWRLSGLQRRLDGERSANTRFTTSAGRDVVLQVQSASERPDVIDLQTTAMQFLATTSPDLPLPRVVPTITGESIAHVDVNGSTHLARMVTFLPGTTFDPDTPRPPSTYRSIGELLGRIAATLSDFHHPAASHFMPWDLANGVIVDTDIIAGASESTRAAIDTVSDRLVDLTLTIGSLPRQIVHNDGHGGNLIHADGEPDRVAGLIDFGDLVHTVRAADVAIIAESFAPAHEDPAGVVAAIAAGYHDHSPLSDAELDAVPELVLGRIALGMLLVDHRARHHPHLATGADSTLRWLAERLERWRRLDPDAMRRRIRDGVEHPS